MHLDVCLIIGMCARRFGLGFTHDAIYIFARHMFMHTYSFLSLYLVVIVLSLSLSFSLSLSLSQIDCIWQPSANHKSTLAKNPLGSGSSSSDPPVLPLHVRFRDGKAQQDFLEKFKKRGVHLEYHIVLSDFSDTPLPVVI